MTAPPNAWRADLRADVDARAMTIETNETTKEVVFRCEKIVKAIWPSLRASGDPETIEQRRAEADAEHERETRSDAERVDAERRRVARSFLERQWAIEDERFKASTRSPIEKTFIQSAPTTSLRSRWAPPIRRTERPPLRATIDVEVVLTPCECLPARNLGL